LNAYGHSVAAGAAVEAAMGAARLDQAKLDLFDAQSARRR